ncbi:MAG TPA: alpha/beta hydrolase [Bryobacteraceae bacterium]|nr:alpha/beta hydrolase [Bryobacteraceae bacterium]
MHIPTTHGPAAVFLLLALSLSAQAQSASVNVEKDVVYGTIAGTALHLDIYQPTASGSQVSAGVILLHGGGWTSFDKSTMTGMGQFLARNGYVGFAADYRLFDGDRNRWPSQLDDVQLAVRWIRANASKYQVDPDRIGAFGHSAGAQLAALLGLEDTREHKNAPLSEFSSKVQAVVDVSGPSDFTRDHDADGDAFFTRFFGSSNEKAWLAASPISHVTKNSAPFLIVHGTRDDEVRISQSQELYDKLRANGVPAEFIKVDDAHTFQTPEARRQLALATLAFFRRYLAASK